MGVEDLGLPGPAGGGHPVPEAPDLRRHPVHRRAEPLELGGGVVHPGRGGLGLRGAEAPGRAEREAGGRGQPAEHGPRSRRGHGRLGGAQPVTIGGVAFGGPQVRAPCDVLVTHEPPYGTLDEPLPGRHVGSRAVLDLVREEAARRLDRTVGEAAIPLPAATEAESPLTNLVADALCDICRADLAVFFSGFVASGLPAGPITRRALYQALPGSTHVTAAQVTGAQVWRMVEKMLAPDKVRQKAEILRNQRPLGLPAVSRGVQITYNLDAPPGSRLVRMTLNGEPIAPERVYRLTSTYYTLNDLGDVPEYGYVVLEAGQTLELVRIEDVLWEIMEGWIKAQPPLRAQVEGRLVALQ